MGSIYGCALVINVVASGGYADADLPGTKSKSRICKQELFSILDVLLLQTLDPKVLKDRPFLDYLILGESVVRTFREYTLSSGFLIEVRLNLDVFHFTNLLLIR